MPSPTPLGYQIRVIYDDAVVVHINGDEIARSTNLPGTVLFDTFATATTPDNTITSYFTLPPDTILAGDNVIAVEVHQASGTSSDISFDFELVPLVPSPYPAYFSIEGDRLVTAVDFATTGISPPFTFEVPIVAQDPSGQTVERLLAVDLTGGAADTDLDGLPDAWEQANFGDLGSGPDDDPDSDGRDNGDEYGADTDPNSASDFLQISSVVLTPGGAELRWQARPDRTYALYRSDSAAEGTWELVQGGLSVVAPGELSATDPAAPDRGPMCYRVEAQAPPVQ